MRILRFKLGSDGNVSFKQWMYYHLWNYTERWGLGNRLYQYLGRKRDEHESARWHR